MKVVHSIFEIPHLEEPITLTIGVYDGLHLGHQAILKELHKESKKEGCSVVLTFSNHPSTYLNPNTPVPLLITFNHRLKLFEKEKIDLVIALPFNANFANQSYDSFFKVLCTYLPIKHLIVGEDARFGKGRKGGPKELENLKLFKITDRPKETYHKQSISSANIRSNLENGNLKKVKKMLGRPYSLCLPFNPTNIIQEDDFRYKWITGVKNICLLPSAVYAVDLQTKGKKIPAIAFYRGIRSINHTTELSLTLIFEKKPSPTSTNEIEIIFISYLHDDFESKIAVYSANPLKTLKPEPFLS